MNHNFKISGLAYNLRPVTLDDAEFIVHVRLQDSERNKFINPISSDVLLQKKWIDDYFQRDNDYYFIIENKVTGCKEGLISLYNVENNKAEWGRWVLLKGSLAATESVDLIYRFGFEKLNLNEIYSRTVEDNEVVVNFHRAIFAKFRKVIEGEFNIKGKMYNAIEQFVDKEYYYSTIQQTLNDKIIKIFNRNVSIAIGGFKFHHIGIATVDIKKDLNAFRFLGYNTEASFESDYNQGVKGLFLSSQNQPRLELLENLENSTTLDFYIKNKCKMYHFGYLVKDIEKAYSLFVDNFRAKVVSGMKVSSFFGQRICFIMLSNMFMIELIEDK